MPSDIENARSAGVPDEEIADALAKKHRYDITKARSVGIPDSEIIDTLSKPKESSLIDKAKGIGEAGLSLATGATTGAIGYLGGAVGGIGSAVAQGKFGTQEGVDIAHNAANKGANMYTYQPRTEEGQQNMQTLSSAFDESKLAGLPVTDAGLMSGIASGTNGVEGSIRSVKSGADTLPAPKSKMVGVGSAETDAAMQRQQRADALGIKLTKGQRNRSFEDQQFERETAKNSDVGGPLRQRYSDQNQKILQNFDSWVDQTGAQAGDIRATGKVVTQAIADKAKKAKTQIDTAYSEARESGDMAQRIDAAPLVKYLTDHEPESINAGVISAAQQKLNRLVDKNGTVSINDLEEVRKMVGNLSGKDATNAHFGGEIKSNIDALTDGVGGDAYKKARSLRTQYANEFENVGVIDKLLSTKPGTKDRSVAYEDVFDHSILKGSLDDVRSVRRTLQTAGEDGKQAWRELQGATINHIKEQITKSVSTDSVGNQIVSPSALKKTVDNLDKDGKLDFVFGKKGAQQIRDIRDTAVDVYTAPPGSVNTSGTSSALITAMDHIAGMTSKVPLLHHITKKAASAAVNSKLKSRVSESVGDPQRPGLLGDVIGDSAQPTEQQPLRKAQ